MGWVFIALFDPMLHAVANVFDNYLANRLWKHTGSLVFYAIVTNVIFVPFIFLIQFPDLPTHAAIPWIVLVGALDVLYLFPYYRALQHDDTSTVSALFSLSHFFVPVLAFFIVGEVLGVRQYIGFALIVVGSVAVTWRGRLRIHRSLLYMAIASFLVALEAVLYKYLFGQMNWSTAFVWSNIASLCVAVPMLVWPDTRRAIKNSWGQFKKNGHIFVVEELLTFGGAGAMTYAIALAPVTLAQSIGALQPFFVLLFAVILGRTLPGYLKEKIDIGSILKKCVFFAMMGAGVVLILKV